MRVIYEEFQQPVALAYLRHQLASGKTLSGFLLQAIERKEGELSYFSPGLLSPEKAIEFETGHTFDFSSPRAVEIGNISGILYPTPTTLLELFDFVRGRLADSDHFSLFEDPLSGPSDPWLEHAKSRILIHGDAVYQFAPYTDEKHENVLNAILEANNALRLVGIVGRMSNVRTPPDFVEQLSLAALELIGGSAECIFVSAFDGEGFVVWEASKPGGAGGTALT
jgi:hypothetical protein